MISTGTSYLLTIESVLLVFTTYILNLIFETNSYHLFKKENKNNLKIYAKDKYQKEKLTIMFIDIENFTNISEDFKNPRLIGFFLNSFFKFIEDSIIQHNGLLDKIMGDGALLVFRGKKGAENATNCGLYLLDNKEKFIKYLGNKINQHNKDSKLYKKILSTLRKNKFDIRVGISTGTVLLGRIGGPQLNNPTIIGDHVNIASRLESINKIYKTNILIDQQTANELDESNFLYRLIDKISVKGKNKPVYIYQPIRNYSKDIQPIKIGKKDVKVWNKAINHYLDGDFQKAYKIIQYYQIQGPTDPISNVFAKRIRSIIDGDIVIKRSKRNGVWKFKEK